MSEITMTGLARRVRKALLLAGLGAALVGAGCGGADDAAAPARTTAAPSRPAPAIATASVVERVLPSIVNIRVEGLGRSGEASGVVVDRDGTIVTNNHVVEGASEVTVAFNDGRHPRPLAGTVVGTAPERDLAVIRVDADDLVPVELGRSSALRLGYPVLALGYPLGLGPTVTQGIVSGLERTIEPSGGPRLEGLLQIDAAINPGNSGGALVDAAGRLVGINTAGAGFAENIGFAIAIDQALPVIDEIRTEPLEERAWLGVSIESIESSVEAAQVGLPTDARGALIVGVYPGSPAEAAGLRAGELITAVAGQDVESAADLTEILADLEPGQGVELEVASPGGGRSLDLELTGRPAGLGS
jgi:S1-C subfamily serine protease